MNSARENSRGAIGGARADRVRGEFVTPARAELNEQLPRLVEMLWGDVERTWLDVGCGTGVGFELLRAGGARGRYIGVDLEPRPAVVPTLDLTADFIAADVLRIVSAIREPCDGAISVCAFEHFADDIAALRAVREALQPDAFLLLVVPAPAGRLVWGPRHGYHWYSAGRIRRRAKEAGFDVDDIRPVGGAASTLAGLAWFIPAYVMSRTIHAVCILLAGGSRRRARERHPWLRMLLSNLQFAHTRTRAGRRAHRVALRWVRRLDRVLPLPPTTFIAVLRRPA